jgi:GNAT superfamily N-acetyltransferase
MTKARIKPKKDWIPQFKDNTAISDVIWGVQDVDGKKSIGWVGLTPSTKPFSNFINKAQKEVFTNGIVVVPNWHYDEIIQYAHQNSEYKVKKIALYTSDFIAIEEEYGKVLFVPYADGVMLYGINIKPELRGKGIGTNIMNKLYDISEEMNIPIYLIPYPDDNFPTKDEKKLVDRLKNYYTRIGFGPVSEDSLVWNNFE